MMITGPNTSNDQAFIKKMHAHLEQGIRLIYFRAKHLSATEYSSLATELLKLTKHYDAILLLEQAQQELGVFNAKNTHLSSQKLMKTLFRPPTITLLSASCHNQEQLLHAQRIGCDLVTLSPVHKTRTHPQASPLGWQCFAQLCRLVSIPVYALGGLSEHDLAKAQSAGAHGIAAITTLWDKKY